MSKFWKTLQLNTLRQLNKRVLTLVIALLSILHSTIAISQENTKNADEPIRIESDSAEYDDKKGVAHYFGNVVANKESKELNSDELHMHKRASGFDMFIAKGIEKRAILTNLDPSSDTIGTGMADTIIYDTTADKMDFIGNAEINQDGYIVTGEHLTYYFENQKLIAPKQEKTRTKVTLPANSMKG